MKNSILLVLAVMIVFWAGFSCSGGESGETDVSSSSSSSSVSSSSSSSSAAATCTVTYNGNGPTSGSVPTDGTAYTNSQTVTVLSNTGGLLKINVSGVSYRWTGWTNSSGTTYTAGETFAMGSASVTLYAKWSVLRGTGPAGGLVFYDKGSYTGSPAWRYLEAAPASTEWTGKQWGCDGSATGSTATNVGTGYANTTNNVEKCGEADRAARLCNDLVYGGYSDWFLPSKDELYEICWVLHSRRWNGSSAEDNPAYGTNRVGGFAADFYWSSSEYDANLARSQFFFNGDQTAYPKNNIMRVRAVRAF